MKPKVLVYSVMLIVALAAQGMVLQHTEANTSAKAADADLEARKAAQRAAGKVKATAVCAACHGANGISVADHIPNLAGQRASYLMGQLTALKEKSRKHDVMNPIAAQLGDDDIKNLAAYFASQPGASGEARSQLMQQLAESHVSIPENYRLSFTPYHSVQSAEEKSLTIYYANDKAIVAAKAGTSLPEGSIIIAENNTAKLDADKKPITGADGHFVADKITSYAAMARDEKWGNPIPEMLRNENWSYGMFNAARERRINMNYAECFACHKAMDKSSFVFTLKPMAAWQRGLVKAN